MFKQSAKLAFLCILTLLLAACTVVEAAPPMATGGISASGQRDFGHPDALLYQEGDFTYTVVYPRSGIAALDSALSAWAEGAVRDAITARTMSHDGRLGGELAVNYDAYLVDDRFASVVMHGQYTGRGSGDATRYLTTLTYDLQAEQMLSYLDVLPYTAHPQAFALIESALAALNPGLEPEALDVNAAWLEPLVLTPQGVAFVLGENRLGLSHWPDRLSFEYSELEGILFLPGQQPEPGPETPPATQTTDPAGEVVALRNPDYADLDPDRPVIALTFDDGPSKITAQLLELLDSYNVPATFFMIGRQVPDYPEVVQQMADQGCELASHTWDHPDLSRQTQSAVVEQFTATADAIEAAAGVRPNLVRPPYGEANQAVRAIAGDMGIYLINWSVDTLDWKSRDAQAVHEHILETVRDGYIILCHDLYQSTYEAMELSIPALLEQGYQFVTVSQLLDIEGGARETGVIYRHR